MRKNEWIALSISATALTIVLIIITVLDIINTAQGIEIILLFFLVLATLIYAKRTSEIAQTTRGQAQATREQADASVKMAKATSEQLLSEARPYLLIRLEDEVIDLFTIVSDANRHEMPNEFKVTIRNVGKGPAINIIAAFWRSDDVSPTQPKGYLAPQEEWHTTISTLSVDITEERWLPELSQMVKYDFPGTVAVEYHDIHHRTWVTYLCLARFDEEAYVVEGEQNIIEVSQND